jgi:predicted GNAT family acetyltransferase
VTCRGEEERHVHAGGLQVGAGLAGHHGAGADEPRGVPWRKEARVSQERPPALIRDNPDGSEYEAEADGKVIGIIGYSDAGPRRVLINTAVEPEYRHQGIAHQLIAHALGDIRARGGTVTILCPIVLDFIEEHPEYAGLVDPAHPGRTRRPG